MAPWIQNGEQVQVQARRFYFPGDVLAVFSAGHRLTLHRLVGYRFHQHRLQFLTKADSASHWDSPVTVDRVVGRVTATESVVHFRPTLFQRVQALGAFLRLGVQARLRKGYGFWG